MTVLRSLVVQCCDSDVWLVVFYYKEERKALTVTGDEVFYKLEEQTVPYPEKREGRGSSVDDPVAREPGKFISMLGLLLLNKHWPIQVSAD
jgi:hypothetical protein